MIQTFGHSKKTRRLVDLEIASRIARQDGEPQTAIVSCIQVIRFRFQYVHSNRYIFQNTGTVLLLFKSWWIVIDVDNIDSNLNSRRQSGKKERFVKMMSLAEGNSSLWLIFSC